MDRLRVRLQLLQAAINGYLDERKAEPTPFL